MMTSTIPMILVNDVAFFLARRKLLYNSVFVNSQVFVVGSCSARNEHIFQCGIILRVSKICALLTLGEYRYLLIQIFKFLVFLCTKWRVFTSKSFF